MIHRTKWRGSFRKDALTLIVYHALKLTESIIFLGSLTLFSADDWAARWLWSRDDE